MRVRRPRAASIPRLSINSRRIVPIAPVWTSSMRWSFSQMRPSPGEKAASDIRSAMSGYRRLSTHAPFGGATMDIPAFDCACAFSRLAISFISDNLLLQRQTCRRCARATQCSSTMPADPAARANGVFPDADLIKRNPEGSGPLRSFHQIGLNTVADSIRQLA